MKIKVTPPKEKLFQVWAMINADDQDDCIIIQADNREHAEQIARQYWKNNNDLVVNIYSNVQIDLITEDK